MEEDIKILEELVQNGTIYVNNGNTVDKAIENLIKGYRELEKENESLVRQYEYQGALMVNEYFSKEQVFELFIPKSKIKEKIEELENKPVCLCTRSNGKNDEALQHFINNTVVKVLQELMEDK